MRRFAALSVLFTMIFNVLMASDSFGIYNRDHENFKTIEYIGWIDVELYGNAEDMGLHKESLSNFVKLKCRNNFAEIPIKTKTFEELLTLLAKDKEEIRKIGAIEVKVWTVGDDYLAIHLKLHAGTFSEYVYTNENLGVGPKEQLIESTKSRIERMIEELAIEFFRRRGEL